MYEWEADFEPHILERGRSYARKGAVQLTSKQYDTISAVVEGSEYYKVNLHFDGHRLIDGYCSCPYAAKGIYCKHMAAVLYKAEALDGMDFEQDPSASSRYDSPSVLPLADLIHKADRQELEGILLELSLKDDWIESRIRTSLAGTHTPLNIAEGKQEIDRIFHTYSDRGGFINYHNAFDFACDLEAYLEKTASLLIAGGAFASAFDLSTYAYVKLGNWDIDDDGEITMISRCCYKIWQDIVTNCSDAEKNQIRQWFLTHSEDGTVIDYMEDTLCEFLRYELATCEKLQEEIDHLDDLIEKNAGKTRCPQVFTFYYGYNVEAIDLRIIFMKRLGASDDEIDAYRRRHMSFQSVRNYYVEQARAVGDEEEEIRLLNQSKILDSSSYLVHLYSERLIELYHQRKEYALEKAERRAALLSQPSIEMEDFRAYRKMFAEDEWEKERQIIIQTQTDPVKRCELLAEERMLPELFKTITAQEDRLQLINTYGFLLADTCSEPILWEYCRYVTSLAEYARNRSNYAELVRYLRRMQRYTGGPELVQKLCMEWISSYPTRKVMVQELQALLK